MKKTTSIKGYAPSKNLYHYLWISLALVFLNVGVGRGQTNPTAQTLPYSQNFGTSSFTAMPAGMAAWNGINGGANTTQTTAEASTPSGNATVATQTSTTTTGGVYGYASLSNARVYIQTSGNDPNGTNQVCLAINTTGNQSITISYDVEIISAQSRTVGIVMQYRVGTTGTWTTVTGTGNPYSQTGGTTGVKASPSLTLPSAANNQSVIQIRWATWRGTQSGSSSGIAIDNISVSGSPLSCTAPSTQASNITFSNVFSNQMTVNWTRGGTPGDGVIVVAKAGSAPDNPSNDNDYTANTAFGSGTEIGTGTFVVFNGAGTSVNVTGLSASTEYHFKVFEKNCTGSSTKINLTSPPSNSQTTTAACAVNPTITSTTAITAITASGASSGATGLTSGENCLITAKGVCWSTSPNPTIADSKTTDGSGTDDFISSITGLSAQTLYYVRAYATNGFGTSYGPELSFRTLSTELNAHPANFTATAASSSQINLTFSAASTITNADGYIILRRTGSNPTSTNITDGVAPTALTMPMGTTFLADINSTATTTYNSTGLNANTQYNYAIIAYNWDGVNPETYNYYTGGTIKNISATTMATAVTLPYTQNFESTTNEWVLATTGTNKWAIGSATNNGGTKALYISNDGGATNVYTLNSSQTGTDAVVRIDLTGQTAASLSFDWKSNGELYSGSWVDYGEVYINIGGSDIRLSAAKEFVNTTTFATKNISLTPYVGGVVSLKFRWVNDGSSGNQPPFAIDNISITAGDYPSLTTTTTTSITTNGVTTGGNITNDGGSAISARGVCYGTSPNPTIAGDKTSDGTGTGSFVSTISGLIDNTIYYVRAYATNSTGTSYGNEISFTTSSVSATTANAATSLTTTEFTANWDAVVGASEYKLDVYSQTSGTNATDLFISEYIEGNSNNKYIEIFNGTGASIDLSNYKLRLYNNGGSSPDNDVMLSGTLQNNSTIVYKNSNASLTLPNGVNATNSTACAFNGDDAIALFKISSNSNVDIFGRIGNDPGTAWTSASNSTLDKTLVRKSSVLGGIATNPSGTGSTAFTTLESEWTQFDIDNVSNLGSHAFDGGTILSFSIQNLSVASTSQEVTGLTPNTTYHYRVRAVGANSTSANSNVVSVLTLPAAPVAEAASTVNALNFVANWTLPATGADSYTLDVATDEDFNNKLEAYDNLTVTGTSRAISGLSRNTTYYYRVKSVNASGASVSNVISVSTGNAITVTGSNESAGSLADCADCDLVVNQGSHLTVNANKSFNSVTIKPGAKLTLNNGQTFAPGTFVLESNASATATFVDKRTHTNKTDITATVQQHLPAASTRTWWYLASPVDGASYTVFGSNKIGDYSETTRSYSNPFTEATTLTAGKGYVVKMTAESAANYIFENKTLNTGNISVPLTRTVTETPDNAKRGFNLVGNPYPSYIDWNSVYLEGVNVRPTIWYRTLDGTSMEFHTYNAELGVGSPTSASEYIPPMQAFWVKVDKDPTVGSVSNGTLNFTNDMRSHDESVDGNPLKTPAADRNLVRLSISNGTLSDETVIATHPSASDSYDRFDSEKMANGDTNRPEIFSMAGNQELVINGISPLTDSKQIALGVRPGRAGNYTISLTEWRNTGNMEAVLRDNQLGEELILTESSSYSFDTDGNASTSRFSLLFRAKGSTTGFDRISSDLLIYSTQNTIRVESASLEGNAISIFNALGQPVFNGKAQSNRLEINGLTPAVYMVKVNNQTKMVIVK